MGVTEDGIVFAFEYNHTGELGVGDYEERLVPILLRGELKNKSILQVAAGNIHTMFVAADGLVYACGNNDMEQLGVGNTGRRLVPTLVTGQLQGQTAMYVAAGNSHTLCTTANGSVFTWGSGNAWRLGLGDDGPISWCQHK